MCWIIVPDVVQSLNNVIMSTICINWVIPLIGIVSELNETFDRIVLGI